MSTANKCPWPDGTPIRLARPERDAIRGLSSHPYSGCIGVVIDRRSFDPVFGRPRKGAAWDAPPAVVSPARLMIKVRLDNSHVEPRWKAATDWWVFDGELERTG